MLNMNGVFVCGKEYGNDAKNVNSYEPLGNITEFRDDL